MSNGKVINFADRKKQVRPEILRQIAVRMNTVEITSAIADGTKIVEVFEAESALEFGTDVIEAALDAGAKAPTLLSVPPSLASRFEAALESFAARIGEKPEVARKAFVIGLLKRGLDGVEKEMGSR